MSALAVDKMDSQRGGSLVQGAIPEVSLNEVPLNIEYSAGRLV